MANSMVLLQSKLENYKDAIAMTVTQHDYSQTGNGASVDSLNQRIEQIIKKRQSLAERVQPVQRHLETLLQEMIGLSQHRYQLRNTIHEPDATESLNGIQLAKLENQIQEQLEELKKLSDRFSRSTLNIGVVGLMRQGKSTFLQCLSGLTNNEIPALKGGPCTAVRSKIYHHEGKTKAIVTLHSEDSFLQEVIAPYYERLDLGAPPKSLNEFASTTLFAQPRGVTLQTMYDHLQNDYHANLHQYCSQLQNGSPRKIEIPQEEIPTYVRQQRDQQDRLTTFNHLAVREVEIYCEFQQAKEVGNLGLVDVPGLGDTRLGDEALILKTLGCEVDLVLFFRRPDSKGYKWDANDLKLYELADQALPNLSERAFMVLNHQCDEGNNEEACQHLQKTMGKMKVVDGLIADCSKPSETKQVIDRVLDHLDQNILALEEQYARSRQRDLFDLHQTVNTELQKASGVLKPFTHENQKFRILFKDLSRDLSNGLRYLLEDLEKEQETTDTDFEGVVKAALKTCESDSIVPSEDEIRDRRSSMGLHCSYMATYCVYIAELRADLSKNFLAIDEGLQQVANKLKVRVAEVLVEKARLGGLTEARGVEFLETLTEMLAERQNPLELGFHTLSTFKVSYGALILRFIRQNLMAVLDSDEVAQRHELTKSAVQATAALGELTAALGIQTKGGMNSQLVENVMAAVSQLTTTAMDSVFDLNPKSIREKLVKLHQRAVEQCRKTLENWLKAPNQIRYYMATEFVDRVLDAKNMEAEWDAFLRDPEICVKVWDEFGQIEALKVIHQQWTQAVSQALHLNQRRDFEFLK
jgi:Dynamin family